MNKHLLRVDEAATLLSVSRWTIYRWVQEGRLEATKVGKGSPPYLPDLCGCADRAEPDLGRHTQRRPLESVGTLDRLRVERVGFL